MKIQLNDVSSVYSPDQVQFDFLERSVLAEESWANVVCIGKNLTEDQAKDIAARDPEIAYFMYVGEFVLLRIPPAVSFDPNRDDPFNLAVACSFNWGDKVYDGYSRKLYAGDVVFCRRDEPQSYLGANLVDRFCGFRTCKVFYRT